ncbi:uncharacterized protein LOC123537465 [Mercenaria mercenaria]|uniref:uncharacterized protein LOC123537465 n=1 Tax=Mercenaria mercenaria TaxID=6596 RepID=UPI00234E5AF1|nr:uncharacterized protein LOC123537465 [Mercenaria mercenaria]
METSFLIRTYLICFSISSLILQIIGLTGHNWFGFSLTMNTDGINVTGKMHGGLFHFSPLEICEGNQTVCKTPDLYLPEERKTFDELNRKFSQILLILRSLVITGITTSSCGIILLYLYLFTSKKPKILLCTGTASAISWMFTALPELTAVGVQIYVNLNIKKSVNIMPNSGQNHEEDNLQATFITPWDVTIVGVGAALAFVVGVIVFLTTFEKLRNNTVIRFRKSSLGNDEIRIIDNNEENTDEEEI